MIFCSQCKYSKYVDVREVGRPAERRLRCERFEELDLPELLPVRCIEATACPLYDPERAQKKSFAMWIDALRHCHITFGEILRESF